MGHLRSVRTQSTGAATTLPSAGAGSEHRFLHWRTGGDFFCYCMSGDFVQDPGGIVGSIMKIIIEAL